MVESDKKTFAQLLLQIDEICKNIGTKKTEISSQTIDFYFEILRDLPFEIIKNNAVKFFRNKTGFFPSPADFRSNNEEQEALAIKAWERINFYLDRFYHPDLGSCMMNHIKERMEKNGEIHLYNYLLQWGTEIISGGSIAATRKHFLDAYKANKVLEEKRQLEAKQPIALIDEINKKLKAE
ncbi:MAG TPA: hypothetical protein PLP19_10590 [bacterium]|nr:hypothetical protein [bacterium]HPN43926.1 hypothetical protein [bacterium]